MVDLSEQELFENDVIVAFKSKDIEEFKRTVEEQQRFIKQLIKENLQMREFILDTILNNN